MSTPFFVGFAFMLLLVSGCSRTQTPGVDSAAYVPTTGSARGIVDPNALPGIQTAPRGASAAGSHLY